MYLYNQMLYSYLHDKKMANLSSFGRLLLFVPELSFRGSVTVKKAA